ncbi:hypothetical protein G3A39_38410 [Paraburkholderia aspalathi]|nr:hypothetical protein [Paraburkholderia aspalathi]
MTPTKIFEHYLTLKRGWKTPQDLADFLGVKRQTVYQYAFRRENKAARTVSAEGLDRMRVAVIERDLESVDRFFPPFKKRSESSWLINVAGKMVSTTCKAHAAYLAGCARTSVQPHSENPKNWVPDPKEMLAMRWLTATRQNEVPRSVLMEITGLDEYNVGRVGLIWLNFGIVPNEDWIEDLESYVGEVRHAA